MMKIKNIRRKYTLVLALLLLCSVLLSSCILPPINSEGGSEGGGSDFSPAESSEDILASIAATEAQNDKEHGFVSDYFKDWGFPRFDKAKVDWVEAKFYSYYNFEGGISAAISEVMPRAAAVARLFIEKYYDETDLTDTDAVTTAIIDSYVEYSGDPYAIYRSGEEFNDFNTDMSGKFYGIGLTVEYNHQDESLMVATVFPDAPADKAGFKVGDFIYAIEGTPISEIGYLNAVYYIRGEKDTPVNVTVLRGDELIELTAIRDEIIETSVIYEITDEGYGYIQITTFKDNTDEQFAEAIDIMREEQVKGVIFDLRNNTGGYLDTVVNMLSYILPTGKLLLTYEYKTLGSRSAVTGDDYYDKALGKYVDSVLDIPMVVLCNEYTASAAEIFTSVIRDYRNEDLIEAVTVGQTTFGKGIMQSTLAHSDGSSITLTIAYYNPPCGINYHGIGITPDVQIDNTETEDLQYASAVSELLKLINAN